MGSLTKKQVGEISKPGRYGDGNGLYLLIAPSGTKNWIQRVRLNGKRTDKGLGVVEFESCGVPMLRMPTESDIASRARGILRNSAQNSETVGNIDKNPAQNYAQNPAQNSESDNFAHLESGAADCAKPLPCAKLEGNFAQDFAHHETVVNNGLPAPAQNCAKLLPLARAPEVLPCGHAVGYAFDGACDGACMVNGCEGKGD